MKKIEMLYRKFFNVPNEVGSRVVYARILTWVIVMLMLGIIAGAALAEIALR